MDHTFLYIVWNVKLPSTLSVSDSPEPRSAGTEVIDYYKLYKDLCLELQFLKILAFLCLGTIQVLRQQRGGWVGVANC